MTVSKLMSIGCIKEKFLTDSLPRWGRVSLYFLAGAVIWAALIIGALVLMMVGAAVAEYRTQIGVFIFMYILPLLLGSGAVGVITLLGYMALVSWKLHVRAKRADEAVRDHYAEMRRSYERKKEAEAAVGSSGDSVLGDS